MCVYVRAKPNGRLGRQQRVEEQLARKPQFPQHKVGHSLQHGRALLLDSHTSYYSKAEHWHIRTIIHTSAGKFMPAHVHKHTETQVCVQQRAPCKSERAEDTEMETERDGGN